ncbi:uncharacterized protein [Drosophila pseudoobscura]|uniref:Uncharacterized protein n=1 Tax=Drosophila pseudoobscura pseudoobscura TaxID=46245 RepID=A0A6I8V9R9_DROPS|nr:uncharacterized protein LOC6902667 [Drosophila pseudoobscura]
MWSPQSYASTNWCRSGLLISFVDPHFQSLYESQSGDSPVRHLQPGSAHSVALCGWPGQHAQLLCQVDTSRAASFVVAPRDLRQQCAQPQPRRRIGEPSAEL